MFLPNAPTTPPHFSPPLRLHCLQNGLASLASLEDLTIDNDHNGNHGYDFAVALWDARRMSFKSILPLATNISSMSIGKSTPAFPIHQLLNLSVFSMLTSLTIGLRPHYKAVIDGERENPGIEELIRRDEQSLIPGLRCLPEGLRSLKLLGPSDESYPAIHFDDEALRALGRLSKLEELHLLGQIDLNLDITPLLEVAQSSHGGYGIDQQGSQQPAVTAAPVTSVPVAAAVLPSVTSLLYRKHGLKGTNALQVALLAAHAPRATSVALAEFCIWDVTRSQRKGGLSAVITALASLSPRLELQLQSGPRCWRHMQLTLHNSGNRVNARPFLVALFYHFPSFSFCTPFDLYSRYMRNPYPALPSKLNLRGMFIDIQVIRHLQLFFVSPPMEEDHLDLGKGCCVVQGMVQLGQCTISRDVMKISEQYSTMFLRLESVEKAEPGWCELRLEVEGCCWQGESAAKKAAAKRDPMPEALFVFFTRDEVVARLESGIP